MQKFTVQKLNLAETSLEQFQKDNGVQFVSDTYEEQLRELFLVRNPKYRFDKNFAEPLASFVSEHLAGKAMQAAGNWLYFEWRKTLVHLLSDELFQELRTARNRKLINAEEQQKLYSKTIAVTGLSVGSHGAFNIVLSGVGNKFKLSDFDTISVSNLNRITAGVTQVAQKKSDWVSRTILEMNPYAEVYVYEQGINSENIEEFIGGSDQSPKVDLLLEELDSLDIKVKLRETAKNHRIPVVMLTDTENPVADVERYDLEPDLPVFNGQVGDTRDFSQFPPTEMVKMITKIIGPENFTSREQQTMLGVGRDVYSWAQLGPQAGICGGLAAYLVRKVLLGANIKSGKYNFNIDGIFDAGYNSAQTKSERENLTREFKTQIGL